MKKEKRTWIRKRHAVITTVAKWFMAPFCRWRYGVTAEPFREQGDRAYLVLMNHQTPFDQFFVAMSFRGAVYYVATEDLFSNGWVSSLIRWLVAPIPIKKQTTDIAAVRNCIRIAREGGTIALAPEGNRTYSGRTEYMNPAIASLARKLKLPIALYRIEGGYGVQPRWSDVIRKGPMRSYVSRVIEPEEYADLSAEELFAMIRDGLAVDEAVADREFLHSRRAEYLERCVYVCPFCGLAEFESRGNEVTCKKCGRKVCYGKDKRLSGEGFAFPFAFVAQWYDYQKEYVWNMDLSDRGGQPLFRDIARLSQVILNKRKLPLRSECRMNLYEDRITIDEDGEAPLILPFGEILAASVLGRNKLNVYHGNMVYQFKGSKRFNAMKYVNFYFRHKYKSRGETDGKFLGL